MRNKKAKALARKAEQLADSQVEKEIAEGEGIALKIKQLLVRGRDGKPTQIDRVTQFFPTGHTRRIYQDLKKGTKGIPITSLCA